MLEENKKTLTTYAAAAVGAPAVALGVASLVAVFEQQNWENYIKKLLETDVVDDINIWLLLIILEVVAAAIAYIEWEQSPVKNVDTQLQKPSESLISFGVNVDSESEEGRERKDTGELFDAMQTAISNSEILHLDTSEDSGWPTYLNSLPSIEHPLICLDREEDQILEDFEEDQTQQLCISNGESQLRYTDKIRFNWRYNFPGKNEIKENLNYNSFVRHQSAQISSQKSFLNILNSNCEEMYGKLTHLAENSYERFIEMAKIFNRNYSIHQFIQSCIAKQIDQFDLPNSTRNFWQESINGILNQVNFRYKNKEESYEELKNIACKFYAHLFIAACSELNNPNQFSEYNLLAMNASVALCTKLINDVEGLDKEDKQEIIQRLYDYGRNENQQKIKDMVLDKTLSIQESSISPSIIKEFK